MYMTCSAPQFAGRFVSTAQLAALTGKPKRTLAWQARRGKLPTVPTGNRAYVFDLAEIERLNLIPIITKQ